MYNIGLGQDIVVTAYSSNTEPMRIERLARLRELLPSGSDGFIKRIHDHKGTLTVQWSEWNDFIAAAIEVLWVGVFNEVQIYHQVPLLSTASRNQWQIGRAHPERYCDDRQGYDI